MQPDFTICSEPDGTRGRTDVECPGLTVRGRAQRGRSRAVDAGRFSTGRSSVR
jgi:hypothetical protein